MIEKTILIDRIESESNREHGGEGDIKILAEDMKRNGLINPITIKAALAEGAEDPGKKLAILYRVTAGRRRLAAARLLGWKEIPCRVLEGDEACRADEIALSENVNRLAMHPLDEAAIFQKLLEAGEPVQNIAKRYDRPVSGIWQRVQLLDLLPEIKELFRAGKITLQGAAMLKGLSGQEAELFIKECGGYDEISDYMVLRYVSDLRNDKLYSFIPSKECGGCKTRTFFTEKSLFPEINIKLDACLNHECYVRKLTKVLEDRVKSLKGEHKSHAAAALLVFDHWMNLGKILGKSAVIGGTEYAVREHQWDHVSGSGGAGAEAAIYVSGNDKIVLKPVYWKTPEKDNGMNVREFSAELKLLDLPKQEAAEIREALKAKKTSHWSFTQKVQEEVFWRLMEYCASNKDSFTWSAEFLLRDALNRPSAKEKKIIKLFTGKDSATIDEILKQGDTVVFTLLYALSLSPYDVPGTFSEKMESKAVHWAQQFPEEIKPLYREAVKKLLPKPKAGKKEKTK